MNIGFVGIILSKPDIKMKSCILKNATPENLSNLIERNIETLDKMLDYNIENNISLFRLSSGMIPFASHPVNQIKWSTKYRYKLRKLGEKALKNGIRLSVHPGQYTLLSSANNDLIKKSILDLKYHAKLLDAMGLSPASKMILHIGGTYNDKPTAMERFIKNYKKLSTQIKRRLVIENDDKNYTISDLIYLSKQTGAPVVFDYLHYLLNHTNKEFKDGYITWIKRCMKTWHKEDGKPKIHYSQQAKGKKAGSHSLTIDTTEFLKFYNTLPDNIDIMLEVKDKNISALNCIDCIKKQITIKK